MHKTVEGHPLKVALTLANKLGMNTPFVPGPLKVPSSQTDPHDNGVIFLLFLTIYDSQLMLKKFFKMKGYIITT